MEKLLKEADNRDWKFGMMLERESVEYEYDCMRMEPLLFIGNLIQLNATSTLSSVLLLRLWKPTTPVEKSS
jgi:hypothetical protein